MGGCTPRMVCMSTCHDFAILHRFKALHIEGTNKNHETLEAWVQININIEIFREGFEDLFFCITLQPQNMLIKSCLVINAKILHFCSFEPNVIHVRRFCVHFAHFPLILWMPSTTLAWESHFHCGVYNAMIMVVIFLVLSISDDFVKSPLHFEIFGCDSIVGD